MEKNRTQIDGTTVTILKLLRHSENGIKIISFFQELLIQEYLMELIMSLETLNFMREEPQLFMLLINRLFLLLEKLISLLTIIQLSVHRVNLL